MSVRFDPLNRLMTTVFGQTPWDIYVSSCKWFKPITGDNDGYVVINTCAITLSEELAISLIDSGLYECVVHCREDGQLSCVKAGHSGITVLTRKELVELLNES